MNRRNYQRELERKIDKFTGEGQVPKLLLHSCCAPCSSYVIEYLSQYFSITVFYYNPNIYPDSEYEKRVEEQKRFIRQSTRWILSGGILKRNVSMKPSGEWNL